MSPWEPGGRTRGETGVSVRVGNHYISTGGWVVANLKDGKSNVRAYSRISGHELSIRLDTSGSNSYQNKILCLSLRLSMWRTSRLGFRIFQMGFILSGDVSHLMF